MPFRWSWREHLGLWLFVLKWLALAVPTGALIGCAVAFFLWVLEKATTLQWDHPWLLYLLPLAGPPVALIYERFGKRAEAGNNLIMEEINEPGDGVPARMAPLILLATVVTHLFGGSAGREGTAVQMGGSLAATVAKTLHLKESDVRLLLMTGVAAGFGSVFGTPLTGAIFAVEVLAIGRMSFEAIIPCLIGSIVGDQVTKVFGIDHTVYELVGFSRIAATESTTHLDLLLLGKVAVAAVAFGLASVIFAELAHGLRRGFVGLIRYPLVRPVAGGLIVIGLVLLLGTRDYIGLGATANPHHPGGVSILSSFQAGGAGWLSWWWKILFTTVTLSSGFKGGEVTPLFFVGAALGNTMARLLDAPIDLFAALGFVAVFAGATNTPLACTVMGVELFMVGNAEFLGPGFVVYLAVACFLAYIFSGHSGIYLSQRIGVPKAGSGNLSPATTLRSLQEPGAPSSLDAGASDAALSPELPSSGGSLPE